MISPTLSTIHEDSSVCDSKSEGIGSVENEPISKSKLYKFLLKKIFKKLISYERKSTEQICVTKYEAVCLDLKKPEIRNKITSAALFDEATLFPAKGTLDLRTLSEDFRTWSIDSIKSGSNTSSGQENDLLTSTDEETLSLNDEIIDFSK